MLTTEGYICFRGDPHGFGKTISYFKPKTLDNYLKIYIKTTLFFMLHFETLSFFYNIASD